VSVLDEAEFARWRSSALRTLDAGAQLPDARAVLAWADAAWELVCTASGSP
jgi:hypothetical protein